MEYEFYGGVAESASTGRPGATGGARETASTTSWSIA